ncbi:MAG: tyrosine-type recombinase/integrase, partial [Solirubrobacteraceae bacterium]
PIDEDAAERKLRIVLDQVAEGIWQPPQAVEPPHEPEPVPTFHQFAEEWWLRKERRIAPKTREDYRWRLERNLIPFFGSYSLDKITIDTVEQYTDAKLAESKPLSARSINMTLVLLSTILDAAEDRKLIDHNPASGKKRRLEQRKPRRTWLDSADAIAALLEAAAELDTERGGRYRRPLLATLLFAGLRIGEATALRWRDVDLPSGWLNVEDSKTDAGRRRVKVRGALHDELSVIKPADADQDAYVFATSKGGPQNPSNVRNRILTPAVERASKRLVRAGRSPLPHLTPHSCRRTFASLLYALGESPAVVMAEMGHTSPALALAVYAQAMRREAWENDRLRALVDGRELAVIGSQAVSADETTAERRAA